MVNKNTTHISEIKKYDNFMIDSGCKVPVPYISVWDGGIEIETTAVIDLKTGEITDITSVDVNGLDICERQYIMMHGEQVDVYENERGYKYWGDIENEILGNENNIDITTKCVNGTLKKGDLVISTPDDEYGGLIGQVIEINLLGTSDHDTDNETDDVHINFLVYEYPKKRRKEIENEFSDLYGEKKKFYDCPLDDVIMAPCCLIRLPDMDNGVINRLLQNGYEAARYCYGILSNLTNQTVSDSTETADIKVRIFDVMESALALAGYEIMDGDRDSVIIRHCTSDSDFEIKVDEIIL